MKHILQKTITHLFLILSATAMLQGTDISVIQLSDSQAERIAQKIWENETAGDLQYLIFWNKNEPFLSLGIAHFLWYGKENRDRYQEMFPQLVAYFSQHNVRLPKWLDAQTACPWESREQFLKAKVDNTPQYQDIYHLMVRTMPIQVDFIMERMQKSLSAMLTSLNNQKQRDQLIKAYKNLLYLPDGTLSTQGIYAMVDYVNFKGEGTSLDERYEGEGWGLLQVLLEMETQTDKPPKEFANAAKKILSRRIAHSPPKRNELQWQKGWFLRLESYYKDQVEIEY